MLKQLSLSIFLTFLFVHSALAEKLRVNVNELEQLMLENKVVVLDTRDAALYETSHLPNARSLPFLKTFKEYGHSGRMITMNESKKILQELGVRNEDKIVAYDTGDMIFAGRVLWFLEVLGHKDVLLLDGGMKAWEKANKPVDAHLPNIITSTYIPSIDPEKYATRMTTLVASKKTDNFYIIDARDEDHFLGQKSDARRTGAIPNSHGIDYHVNLDEETGSLKSLEELKQIYAHVPKDKKIITYCSAGIASAMVYLVLKEQGYNVANYDASWIEWGNDTSLPISERAITD